MAESNFALLWEPIWGNHPQQWLEHPHRVAKKLPRQCCTFDGAVQGRPKVVKKCLSRYKVSAGQFGVMTRQCDLIMGEVTESRCKINGLISSRALYFTILYITARLIAERSF